MRLLFMLMSCWTFNRCTEIQWAVSPEDNTVLYACVHGSVSISWTLLVFPGDVIENIQWTFSGTSDELIATEAHGHFFASPSFSGRVNQSTNAGIKVDQMQVLDSGNYSVEVIVRQASGGVLTMWRSAFVYVTDDVQVVNIQLHVTQLPVAEYNNQTDQYHVVLSCGNFTYPTQPPFLATWLTPSGRSLDSDKYANNQFFLLLPNPVEGGSYTCRVSSPSACVHSNSSLEGSATVDKVEARLAIMETELLALEFRNAELERVLKAKDVAMETELNSLKSGNAGNNRSVSFHAIVSNEQRDLSMNSVIKFDRAVTNVGNAYNASSGVFTAPYNGTYFFAASGEAGGANSYLQLTLIANNKEMSEVQTLDELQKQPGTIHGLSYLTSGETAFVKLGNSHNALYGSPYTTFSGFLIN